MTPWTIAPRFLCPCGFSRQEYWSGLPCPPPGDLPNPGIEPRSPTLQADSSPSEPPGKPQNTGVGRLSLLQGNFLPDPGIELGSPALQVDSLPAELPGLFFFFFYHECTVHLIMLFLSIKIPILNFLFLGVFREVSCESGQVIVLLLFPKLSYFGTFYHTSWNTNTERGLEVLSHYTPSLSS